MEVCVPSPCVWCEFYLARSLSDYPSSSRLWIFLQLWPLYLINSSNGFLWLTDLIQAPTIFEKTASAWSFHVSLFPFPACYLAPSRLWSCFVQTYDWSIGPARLVVHGCELLLSSCFFFFFYNVRHGYIYMYIYICSYVHCDMHTCMHPHRS